MEATILESGAVRVVFDCGCVVEHPDNRPLRHWCELLTKRQEYRPADWNPPRVAKGTPLQIEIRPPRKPAVCRYLGERITRNGEAATVKVACHACGGLKELDYPVYRCELHGRCLPGFRPRSEARQLWEARQPESGIYHLCGRGQCGDFTPLVEIASPAASTLRSALGS